ncbi:universal stress protein [Aquabacterium sp. A7-Y]|uniref:universal stress protein n=1 Tax=Aquabacterium sp. A7-Y TaxID=1349605 RepID=UPI00223E1E93|nr:universal stress protein [Aquabacterium sp. A7-Y]MCW7541304.1 universal stress protein [Aquabacterium sp. A7-Y]
MTRVFACIDGVFNSAAVCDYAAWAAQRLDAPLAFLHVLDRHPERAPVHDLSGAIGLGAQETLLEQLSTLDEQRSRLGQEHGRQLLEAAKRRALDAGVESVEARQRHGELVETVLDLERGARLFVVGEHHRAAGGARLHRDHHVERVVRSVKRPVLVVTPQVYTPPRRFALAFDGSPASRRTVEILALSPLLRGLFCLLVMVGEESPMALEQIMWARGMLTEAGFAVEAAIVPGEAETALAVQVREREVDLLVMGAYGHSRIRQLIVGSTTTTLLRSSEVPVLVVR